MKISDEQYVAIGAQVSEADTLLGKGYIAVAAVAPLLLAGPSDGEMIAANSEGGMPWQSGDTGKVSLYRTHYRAFLANRLASVTAKSDPAPDALRNELRRQANKAGHCLATGIDYDALVAAVDAARAPKP